MPSKPNSPCGWPLCSKTSRNRYCKKHERMAAKDYEMTRPSSSARGYGGERWRKARINFLRGHPLCAVCTEEGLTVPADTVDHKVPHKGNDQLFWDTDNWQALCRSCHSRKTATSDGRWGKPH